MADDRDENEHKFRYNLLWKCEVKPEGVAPDEVPPGWGATHAMIFMSLLYPPDGSFMLKFFPVDGRVPNEHGEAADDSLEVFEVFKAWVLMGHALSNRPDLGEGERKFCLATFQAWADLGGTGPRRGSTN